MDPSSCTRMSARRTRNREQLWSERERCRSTEERGEGRGSCRETALQPGRKGRDIPKGENPKAGLELLPPAVQVSSCGGGIHLCWYPTVRISSCVWVQLCRYTALYVDPAVRWYPAVRVGPAAWWYPVLHVDPAVWWYPAVRVSPAVCWYPSVQTSS